MDTIDAVKLISPALLFLMTLGMGMTMTWDDVRRIVRYPKAMSIGAINQAVVLPLVGFLMVLAFDVRPEIAVGVMLLTFCPGGAGSNISTLLARGDVALSVSLTLISGCLILFTLPLLTNAAMVYFLGEELTRTLPVGETALRLVLMVLAPVALGMFINHRLPAFASRAERYVKISGFVLLSLMIVGVLVKEYQTFLEYSRQAGAVVTALCVTTMTIGFCSARLFRLNRPQSISICIEVGIQNTMLALVIAGLLGKAYLVIPSVIYVVVSSVMLILVIAWAHLPSQRSEASHAARKPKADPIPSSQAE